MTNEIEGYVYELILYILNNFYIFQLQTNLSISIFLKEYHYIIMSQVFSMFKNTGSYPGFFIELIKVIQDGVVLSGTRVFLVFACLVDVSCFPPVFFTIK